LGVCEEGYYCDETGLLGLTFHPNFSENKKFYINYTQYSDTEEDPNDMNWCSNRLLHRITAEFTVSDSNPDVADLASRKTILKVKQPYCNHNAGDLAFGPDGYLYITVGDGGALSDPDENGQNPLSLLGTLLRLDVDSTPSSSQCTTDKCYTIPSDNPFIDDPQVLDEIWAWGLRNPWKIHFDTKDNLYIADVGEDQREEINFSKRNKVGGLNYGWKTMEGHRCYNPELDEENCVPDPALKKPIVEYKHENGRCSVTGGYVVRNKQLKTLFNQYLFGDYCTGTI